MIPEALLPLALQNSFFSSAAAPTGALVRAIALADPTDAADEREGDDSLGPC